MPEQTQSDPEPWLKAGRILAHPPPGQDIVITGISGCYPESDNIYEFRDNLANKADMVTYDLRRWEAVHPEIPKRSGKIWNVEKFDAGFFGIHKHQCNAVDPLCRIVMEKCFECVLDAGINPKDLEGTKTGIYVGACASESEKYWLYDNPEAEAFAITGCHRSMLASRVAYALKLQGPAFVMDTACSSSFFAFEHAYRAIREGRCDRAIVAGTNLCLHPYVTLQFSRLGVLSLDGACKCFDDSANGYTRSEAICAILLQKSEEANRIYAHVVHSKVNSDGYKEQGITYPSGDTQKNLIKEVYMECQLNPNDISFMEAHGTGTKVGDPEELKAIDEIFLKDRDRPLLIGSVKSNIGHTEPTSGLCSISKVILSMESGKILPNMNYQTPRKGVKALTDGSLVVVTENIDWPDDNGLVGINSFGFGGANCHTILRWHNKVKHSIKSPSDIALPLLVCVSGRTHAAVEIILDDLIKQCHDREYVRLFHEIFRRDISGHNYRGFLLNDKINQAKDIKWFASKKPQLIYNFVKLENFDFGQFQQLLQLKQFAATIDKEHQILSKHNINLNEILQNYNKNDNRILIETCCHIAMVEVLKEIGLVPDNWIGSESIDSYLKSSQSLEDILKDIIENQLKERKKSANGLNNKKDNFVLNFEDIFSKDNVLTNFFNTLGKLYLAGFDVNLHVLYPRVEFPVSRGTPMISPLIKWDHSRDWFVTKYRTQDIVKTGFMYVGVDLKDEISKYLAGHVADGRNLFPATGYLILAWDVLGMIVGKISNNMKIAFENVRFLRATNLPTKGALYFTVMVQRGSGNFEIAEGGVSIVTGTIREIKEDIEDLLDLPLPAKSSSLMNQKDIYTELKLRGYNYRGAFKALKEVDVNCSNGKIDWTGNWVTFLDNMLQMQILQMDTRSLYVPTGIKSVIIDAHYHSTLGDKQKDIPVYAYKDLNLIRSGGVEMRGLLANVINRKKASEAVLEKYVFVPNETKLNVADSIRIIMQVCFENYSLGRLKIIEFPQEDKLFTPFIRTILEDMPLIEADLKVFTPNAIDVPAKSKILVEDKKLGQETDCYLIIIDETLLTKNNIENITKSLKLTGFLIVISKEPSQVQLEGFSLFVKHETSSGYFLLYRKNKTPTEEVFIEYDEDGICLNKINSITKDSPTIVLYTDKIINGLLGFTNCLRREQPTSNTKCFISDNKIDFAHKEFKDQLLKNMAINIFKQGQWGTYRHLLLPETSNILAKHAYVNVTTRGDLSSLSWIQGPISSNEDNWIHVHYGAINFRDVMTASGRVSVDAITNDRLEQECVQGFEYAGINSRGRRVMGMLTSGALATILTADPDMLLPVPETWSLEDAVTVPVVYGTALYAFFMRAGGLTPGQSVLIHSGTGGVGQAAIAIALHFGCNVFVTVGTQEKRTYLLKKFPKLIPKNVGNSRDVTFESLVLHRTNNKGVDIVLNSLAEEKLQASLRCLADGGHFLEIGKFDLSQDNELDSAIFQRGITFHGIMLDGLFKTSPETKQYLMGLLQYAIDKGAVVPLPRTVFERDELEKAFRYMATGKHKGKVVIRVRTDSAIEDFPVIPKYYCPNGKSCLVVGGLGGFGLELCDWLVLRGCKNLYITSRKGPKSGYQHLRLKTWRSYGTTVTILKEDLLSQMSCQRALTNIENLDSLFNLAAVLHDGLLENQTVDQLQEVLASKATTTKFLDQLTRTMCPNLQHFVVFSSVSCGRGNMAQANYGMANSIMEKLMEQRKQDGLPALAIQWGSVADVGLAAELINDDLNERPIGGTLPQKMSSCLELLDTFMSQGETIVASMVVAEKRGVSFAENMVDTVVNIMGLRDLKTVSLHSTLPELGMDSMMAVEIKQTLEREYEIFLTPHDIRTLTFARLQQLQDNKDAKAVTAELSKNLKKAKEENVKFLLRFINDEECSKLSVVPMKSLNTTKTKAFLLPGVEGFASILEQLCSKLDCQTIGLQFTYDDPPDTLQEMAQRLLPYILPHLSEREPFNLIAYSFGSVVAIELAILLEKEFGFQGELILIDGAHEMMLKLTRQQNNVNSPSEFETSILCNIFTIYMPLELVDVYREQLLQMANYEERVNFVQSKSPEAQYSKEYIKKVCIAFYKRVKAVLDYKATDFKLQSQITLLKPSRQSVLDIEEDYNLKSFSQRGADGVKVKIFDADHYTILDRDEVALEINKTLMEKFSTGKVSTGPKIKTPNITSAKTR